jgi:1-acyl-sn-glycerol-3-phosphate acyltransferase
MLTLDSTAARRIADDVATGAQDVVWQLMISRAQAGSFPGERTDGLRLALVIEGGGMAGAVSAGMCTALESLGLIGSFDVIYGVSAGALNASYTVAGQARSRCGLYVQAARARLIDPRRVLRGQPLFRLAEIINTLMVEHPHDARLLEAPIPLRVAATRLADKQLELLGDFESLAEVRQAVWASCAIPILAGDIVEYRGKQYVDGGLIESLPYAAALREGATHALVLRSRPAGYRLRECHGPALRAIERALRGAPDTLLELVLERPARYNADAIALQTGELGDRVCQLTPPGHARAISQFETRASRLMAALELGRQATYDQATPYLSSREFKRPRQSASPAAARALEHARRGQSSRAINWIARVSAKPLLKRRLGLTLSGGELIPEHGPVILAANHRGPLDPIALGLLTRRPVYYMAKRELFSSPIKAWLLTALGAFPVDRGGADQGAIAVAETVLRRGDCLAIFPEGRCHMSGGLGRPRRGVGRLALTTGAPVVPIAITGTESSGPLRLPPGPVRVQVGDPLALLGCPRASDHENARLITERIWEAIAAQWEALTVGHSAPPSGGGGLTAAAPVGSMAAS